MLYKSYTYRKIKFLTEKFFNGFAKLRAVSEPVLEPLKVHTDDLFIVVVWKRVVAANLFKVLAVPGSLVVCSYNPVVRSIGTAAHSQTDDNVRFVVLFQEKVPWEKRRHQMSREEL